MSVAPDPRPARGSRAQRQSWGLAGLIASLSMIGPFSIDLYLPAFSAIAKEFSASPIAMQQTLSAYLFAYAFMMLWHGALSDALGRRPIIIGGLGRVRVRDAGLRDRRQHRDAVAVSHRAGHLGGDRHGGRPGHHSRPLPGRGSAAADGAGHAGLQHRSRHRAHHRRRAAEHAGVAFDLLDSSAVGADRAGMVSAQPAGNVAPVASPCVAAERLVAQLQECPCRTPVHAARP